MPLMCLSASITEVHLGFSAGAQEAAGFQGLFGTASILTWMAPGKTVEEAQTQSHCVFTTEKDRMEPLLPNLALPFLAILCASAGVVAENWGCHPEHFRDIPFKNVERKCVNKGIIHAMQLPPCLQPQGAKHSPICGAHVRTEHHRKNGKTALKREICCLSYIEMGWEGGEEVRERSG